MHIVLEDEVRSCKANMEWYNEAFGEAAAKAYNAIGHPQVSLQNAWEIFLQLTVALDVVKHIDKVTGPGSGDGVVWPVGRKMVFELLPNFTKVFAKVHKLVKGILSNSVHDVDLGNISKPKMKEKWKCGVGSAWNK
ncbi:hypothetical protein P691DRAFT_791243 [Macrolepiota fuliginosa MF-IS2]|uniref:Uncharacterized protein n=1 Tax=Macrolepiota fuliginosa MF-IS2 TaxID=1400762 RepID=A0A9P6BV96_9AGAR|nr:hypothetical protein P691DRAFT_791243 [Macrolepiota fuliginosa MF-IS2]